MKYKSLVPKTHIFAIIDRSGSMAGLEKSTIDGYNEFLEPLRATDARLTTVLFDHEYEVIQDNTPVTQADPLDSKTYFVRGSTALIDAVYRTIENQEVPKGDKALVLIITDGLENASRHHTSADLKKLIEALEELGNWTFTYIGANQDSWGTASAFGIKVGNITNYQASERGTQDAWTTMGMNSVQFVSGSSLNTRAFYKEKHDKA